MKTSSMKLLTISLLVGCMTTMSMAGGIYFVSGSDFRKTYAKYILTTDEDHQTVEITPYGVRTVSIHGNAPYAKPWEIKTSTFSHVFNENETIRQKTNSNHGYGETGEAVGEKGVTNVAPLSYTYPNKGSHIVKLYNDGMNVYHLYFVTNPYLTYLEVNQDIPIQDVFGQIMVVSNCPNLKVIKWHNPHGSATAKDISTNFKDLPSLVSMEFSNPDFFTSLGGEHMFRNCPNLTNDMVFLNTTKVPGYFCAGSPRVEYASFPNAKTITANAFNLSGYPISTVKSQNLCLKRLRIGD